MNWADVPDLFESKPLPNPFTKGVPVADATSAAPAAPAAAPRTAKNVLDEIRKVVDTVEPLVAEFSGLVPVAGADIKIGLACLKGGVDAADDDVDQGASTGATILAALKGALAGL